MRVTFSIDFDGGCWPGPLGEGEAAVGEIWVGPGGLLGLLETSLGLRGPSESSILRIAGLIPAVQGIEGFWSESAEHNPLAAARTLLRWRDELWMHGWRGKPLRPRLGQLAQVTVGASAGFPDRLEAVREALETRCADLDQIDLCEPREDLAPLWQRVLDHLEERGTQISRHPIEPSPATGDLAAVQSDNFDPQLDGSLQLLRPYGPQAAAEEVAAWLASHDDLTGTVLIGGDPLLDAALARYGLPASGATSGSATSALLQLLPLILSLGWDPPDPQLVLEFLTSSLCPLPSSLANRLASALSRWPAVGSPNWEEALSEGLDKIEDPDYRERVQTRVAALFESHVSRSDPYPLQELERRVDLLVSWLTQRAETDKRLTIPWWGALAQCSTLLGLVERSGLAAVGAAQLDRFIEAATQSIDLPPSRSAQAGLTQVPRPGSIAGPAKRIIWWSFDQTSAPPIRRLPFSRATQKALTAAGIKLRDPGHEALTTAQRWRRPLQQATESLLLVCPQRSADGEDCYPHPLWDELVGRHGQEKVERLQVAVARSAKEPKLHRPDYTAPPFPRHSWQAPPELLPWRTTESPSSLATLFGCSLQWALRYHARLERGRSLAIPGAPLVLGNLLHEAVETVLLSKPESPAAAKKAALDLFDELLASRAANLLLPGAEAERLRIRRHTGEAAAHLTQLLADANLEVRETEAWRQRPWLGAKIGGFIDLLLGEPPAVIDLKLGGASYRRDELKNGTADSLAIYSHVLRDGEGTHPPVGFYILLEQTLLSVEPDRFPGAEPLEGPKPVETWAAVDKTAKEARQRLEAGALVAGGLPNELGEDPLEESALVDGRLLRPAQCGYCDFAALCGKNFEGESL